MGFRRTRLEIDHLALSIQKSDTESQYSRLRWFEERISVAFVREEDGRKSDR